MDPHYVGSKRIGLGSLLLETPANILGCLLVPTGKHQCGGIGSSDIEIVGHLLEQGLGGLHGALVIAYGAEDLREQDAVERSGVLDLAHLLERHLVLLHILEAHAPEPQHRIRLIQSLQRSVGAGRVSETSEGSRHLDEHGLVRREFRHEIPQDRFRSFLVFYDLQKR